MRIGELIDGLGVELTMDDGDLVTDAIVVMKVVASDGTVRLASAWSEGMSWIERLGMLAAQTAVETPPPDAGEMR